MCDPVVGLVAHVPQRVQVGAARGRGGAVWGGVDVDDGQADRRSQTGWQGNGRRAPSRAAVRPSLLRQSAQRMIRPAVICSGPSPRALTGFDGVTLPALRIDGARIQGSRAIAPWTTDGATRR